MKTKLKQYTVIGYDVTDDQAITEHYYAMCCEHAMNKFSDEYENVSSSIAVVEVIKGHHQGLKPDGCHYVGDF